MRKNRCRTIALACAMLLCLTACLGGARARGLSTVSTDQRFLAEKLLRQLEVGSGFTGTLTVELAAGAGHESEAVTTTKPIVMDMSYIYLAASPTGSTSAEHRIGLSLPGADETATRSLLCSLIGDTLYLRTDLLGDSWYQATAGEDAGTVATTAQGALSQTALPALSAFVLRTLMGMQSVAMSDLEQAAASYTTKLDLWIEGYRQSAELGKLDDGTSTIRTQYLIPTAAIKAQLKQLVLDALNDVVLRGELLAMFGSALSDEYLNLLRQSYYFAAIEALPLRDDMTISRTVSLTGETLELKLSLPFYDRDAGYTTLRYARTAGARDDLPDTNEIELETEKTTLRLDYQQYSTMTDTTVYQGTIVRERGGADSYAVADDADAPENKRFSASFSITHTQSVTTDENDLGVLTHDVQLSVAPDFSSLGDNLAASDLTDEQRAGYVIFPAVDISLDATFKSAKANNAATSLDLYLAVSGEELPQSAQLSLSGRTRRAWTPEIIAPESVKPLQGMDAAEQSQLLLQLALNGGALFAPYLTGAAQAEPTETPMPTDAPTEPPMPTDAVDTPTATPTGTPTATPTATPGATDEPAEEPLPNGSATHRELTAA